MRMDFDMLKEGFETVGFRQEWDVATNTTASTIHKQLWESKDWTDFVIMARAEKFDVHRAVICSQSAVFKAACRPGEFVEAADGVMRLTDEDGTTIETLLRELYGVANDKTGSVFTQFATKYEIEKEFITKTLVRLVVAADKFDIDAVKIWAVEAIADRLPFIRTC